MSDNVVNMTAMHYGSDSLLPAKGALPQGVIFNLEDRIAAARNRHQHDPKKRPGAAYRRPPFEAAIGTNERARTPEPNHPLLFSKSRIASIIASMPASGMAL